MPTITPNLWFDSEALEAAGGIHMSMAKGSLWVFVADLPDRTGVADDRRYADRVDRARAKGALMTMKKMDIAALQQAADRVG
jgi:predicted 3-demethylubiquinone-9 3-methyltransferase (glyoxalase superfamily)